MQLGFDFVSTLLVSFGIFFLGIIVYINNWKSVSNRFFALFSLINAVFLIVNYFSLDSTSEHLIIFIRMVIALAVFQALFFFLFVYHFPSRELRLNKTLFNILVLAAFGIAGIALATGLIFSTVQINDGVISPQPGMLIPLFALYAVGLVLVSIFLVVKKYLHARGKERIQWLLIMLGTALTVLGLVTFNFILTIFFDETKFIQYSSFVVLPMVVFITYAILRHGFLNIKVFATEVFTFVLAVIILLRTFFAETARERLINGGILMLILFFGVLLIQSVLREIRQREQLETVKKHLEAANTRLRELDLMKDELVSIASHELRTPMTAIKGYLWMALNKQKENLNPKLEQYLQRSYDSAERLIDLVNDMLSVSRLEGKRVTLEQKPLDLAKFVPTILDDLMPKVMEKGLKLTFEPKEDLPMASADETRLREIMMNLVGNALKFTEKGRIWITANPVPSNQEGTDKPMIQIDIHDTGKGITEADKERLFTKFGKLHQGSFVKSSEEGGTGLGLYITKGLVELHGGKVWAEGEPGKGTTFSFTIPQVVK